MVKVGIIGAGTMGSFHAGSLANIPEVELAAVADSSLPRAQDLAGRYGAVGYDDPEKLIKDKSIDVIDICLPTLFHKKYTLAAARNGKHVFCEKPIARYLKDGQEMINTCRKNKVKFMVGHVLRYFPEFVTIKNLIDSGEVGRPAVVRATRGGAYPRAWNDWYAKPQMSGGLVLDMIIHDFDFLCWCFGKVKRVFAKGLLYKGLDHLDYALVTLRFANGVIAHVEGSWAHPGGFRVKMEVAGDEGLIGFDSDRDLPLRVELAESGSSSAGIVMPESPLKKSPYEKELAHFIDCVINDKEPEITGGDALYALKISLAALDSIKTGKPVKLS